MTTQRKFQWFRHFAIVAAIVATLVFTGVAMGKARRQNADQTPAARPAPPSNGQAPSTQPPSTRPPSTQPVRPSPGRPGKPGTNPPPKPGKPGTRPPPTKPGKPGTRPPPPRPGKPGTRPPPRPNPGRPPVQRPRPPYNFRPGDYDRMRRHYRRRFGYINRSRRPTFVIGGYIPFGDRGYFSPIPADLLGVLPPPPPGYVIGYFDGYCVVYDPVTFAIINFVDLLAN